MMKYRNVITGTTIRVPCKITGKNWEQVLDDLDNEVEEPENPFVEDPSQHEEGQNPDQDPEQEEPDQDPDRDPAAPKPKTRRGKK